MGTGSCGIFVVISSRFRLSDKLSAFQLGDIKYDQNNHICIEYNIEEKVPWPIVVPSDMTYEEFEAIMEEVSDIIGPGNNYEKVGYKYGF